jgi:hypothetical protein
VIPGVGAPGAWVTVRGAVFTTEGDVRQPGWKVVRLVSSGEIRVSGPAHGPETVNLRVVTASGPSPVTRKDRYTITSPATAAASVLSSVSPRAGPPSGGGARVTVTGSGFIDVKKVAFGTVTGTSLSVSPPANCQVTTPIQLQAAAPPVCAAGDQDTDSGGGTTQATGYSYNHRSELSDVEDAATDEDWSRARSASRRNSADSSTKTSGPHKLSSTLSRKLETRQASKDAAGFTRQPSLSAAEMRRCTRHRWTVRRRFRPRSAPLPIRCRPTRESSPGSRRRRIHPA